MGCCGNAIGTLGRVAKKVVRGAGSLLQAAVHLDPAPAEVVQARRDLCRVCEFATRNKHAQFAQFTGLTTLSRCRKCDCFIGAKTSLASQSCPIGRWPAVAAE